MNRQTDRYRRSLRVCFAGTRIAGHPAMAVIGDCDADDRRAGFCGGVAARVTGDAACADRGGELQAGWCRWWWCSSLCCAPHHSATITFIRPIAS